MKALTKRQAAQFFKFSTLRNILQTLVISGFLAIGSGCLLIGGHIDLSESAVGALGGIVLASAILRIGLPWWLAIILCVVICAIFGLINGLMVMLCSWVVKPHFEVENLWWAMGFSIVLTLVSWRLHLFFPPKKK